MSQDPISKTIKKKRKKESWGHGLSGKVVSMRPWIQSPALQKIKIKR
jgi:hypothetical protein